MTTSTSSIKDLTPRALLERLRNYPSYDTAVQEYQNLNHIFIHLGYECSPENAFNDFVTMDNISLLQKFGKRPIRHLPVNLSINFIVEKLINASQTYIKVKPNIIKIFGFTIETLKRILANYVFSEVQQETCLFDHTGYFLTVDALLELIQETTTSLPQEEVLPHILNQITKKEIVPINERTIIMHAIQHTSVKSFCWSFNGLTSDAMGLKLLKFNIYNHEINRFIKLENPDLILLTVKQIRAGRFLNTKEAVNNLCNEILPFITDQPVDIAPVPNSNVLTQTSAIQEVPEVQQSKKLKLNVEELIDRDVEQNSQLVLQNEPEIYDFELFEALSIFAPEENEVVAIVDRDLEENPLLLQQYILNISQGDLDEAFDSFINADEFYESFIQTKYHHTFFGTQTANKKRSLEVEEYNADIDEFEIRTDLSI